MNPINYDGSSFVFSVPEVRYGYLKDSYTLWGAGNEFMNNVQGYASLNADISETGHLDSGTIQVVGGISSLNIPNGNLLLQGKILDIVLGFGTHFWASFLFRINFSHQSLNYQSLYGTWNAFIIIRDKTAADLPVLFREDWGPASAPLNSYIGQVKCLF